MPVYIALVYGPEGDSEEQKIKRPYIIFYDLDYRRYEAMRMEMNNHLERKRFQGNETLDSKIIETGHETVSNWAKENLPDCHLSSDIPHTLCTVNHSASPEDLKKIYFELTRKY
jgi:hypothetical protein